MSGTGPVRVLVVDDSADQRLLLRTYCERAGCVVFDAGTAEDALALLDTPFDLAIIDLILPITDGWELAALVRSRQPECAIAITSVLDAERYPAEYAALPKPVTGAAVRQALSEIVPRWR